MTGIAVHNAGSTPLVIDLGGHLLGVGEYAAVFPDSRTTALLAAGELHEISGDPNSPGIDPDAAAALRAAPGVVAGDYGLSPSSPRHAVDGGTP